MWNYSFSLKAISTVYLRVSQAICLSGQIEKTIATSCRLSFRVSWPFKSPLILASGLLLAQSFSAVWMKLKWLVSWCRFSSQMLFLFKDVTVGRHEVDEYSHTILWIDHTSLSHFPLSDQPESKNTTMETENAITFSVGHQTLSPCSGSLLYSVLLKPENEC